MNLKASPAPELTETVSGPEELTAGQPGGASPRGVLGRGRGGGLEMCAWVWSPGEAQERAPQMTCGML